MASLTALQSDDEFNHSIQFGWGAYRGDRFGIYSFNDAAESGSVDVDWLPYEHSPQGGQELES